jgi:hypothetical protein
MQLRSARPAHAPSERERACDLLDEVTPDLKRFLAAHAKRLIAALQERLKSAGVEAHKQEEERYRSRQGEVSSLIAENTLAKLEREIEKLKVERAQGLLFDEAARLDVIDRSIDDKQAEIGRRKRHYEEVRAQLDRERERILRHLLPKRHAMSAAAQVFPVALEVRLPRGMI